MLPNVTTIIRTNIGGNARAQAYGVMAGMNALGLAIGPLIGGFLTTYFSWRWAFRLEIFFLLLVLLKNSVIPKDITKKVRPKLDKGGVAWQGAAMMFIVVSTLLISDYGLFMAKKPFELFGHEIAPFGLSIVPIIFSIGIFCLLRFVRHEEKVDAAGKNVLVDLKLFRIKDYVRGLNIRFLHTALMAGALFAVPLFLQVTFNLSPFSTGFVLFALSLGLLITALGGAKRGLQFLPKQKVRCGLLIAITGLLIMAVYVYLGDKPIGIVPGLFIYGLGLGLIASQIVNLIMSAVEPKQTAEAAGVTSTLETLGSSIGTAIVGTVLVVALTAGATKLVNQSTVYSPDSKTQISAKISEGIEVVSSTTVADTIQENGSSEAETIRIYDLARQNAFIITLLFMAFVALVAFMLAKKLPETRTAIE
jgi:MFS family permease